ncbi:MAG: hypothetical protein AAF035_12435 [Pseudomonadota bacterium]
MMASVPLDIRHAEWDRMREAVVIPSGQNQVAIALSALESWVGRALTPSEAIETAVDEAALFRAVANAIPAQDNVITITQGLLNSRSWSVEPYSEQQADE